MTSKILIQCQPNSKTKLRIIEQDLIKVPQLAPVVYLSLGLKMEDTPAVDAWQDRPQQSQSVLRPGESRRIEVTPTYRVIIEEVEEP